MFWASMSARAVGVESTSTQVSAHAGDRVLMRTEYDCTSRELRDLDLIDRDQPNGFAGFAISGGPSPRTLPPFHAVAPETVDEAAFKYVCRSFFDQAQPGEPGWIVGMGQRSCGSFLAAMREHAPNGQGFVEQGNVYISASDLFQQWLWGCVSVESSRQWTRRQG
jgi:hypothetical protein